MTNRLILGVDPGLSGALAFLDPETGAIDIFDMPVFKRERKGKTKNEIDMPTLGRLIDDRGGRVLHAYVELVHAMPKQGVTSSFNFGFGYGVVMMALAANFLPVTQVTPQAWKSALKVPADKGGARQRASQLMPVHAGKWSRAMDDGRAEAAMLAIYGATQTGAI